MLGSMLRGLIISIDAPRREAGKGGIYMKIFNNEMAVALEYPYIVINSIEIDSISITLFRDESTMEDILDCYDATEN